MEEHIMKEGNINKQNEKQLKDWIWLNQKNMFKKTKNPNWTMDNSNDKNKDLDLEL